MGALVSAMSSPHMPLSILDLPCTPHPQSHPAAPPSPPCGPLIPTLRPHPQSHPAPHPPFPSLPRPPFPPKTSLPPAHCPRHWKKRWATTPSALGRQAIQQRTGRPRTTVGSLPTLLSPIGASHPPRRYCLCSACDAGKQEEWAGLLFPTPSSAPVSADGRKHHPSPFSRHWLPSLQLWTSCMSVASADFEVLHGMVNCL